jgi:hypothetical protein
MPIFVAFKGPFINLMPWVPIFADRYSKQTIIYSKRSGGECFVFKNKVDNEYMFIVYVLPSLINRFGKRFSIAELIASGYASLFSSGVRPSGIIDMVPLFQSRSC